MKVRFKKLTATAKTPTRGSEQAAGYDLYADIQAPVEVPPHSTVMIGTGLAVEVPNGYYGAIMARSGVSKKRGLRPANCVGVCDPDYRGEYMIAVHNDTDKIQTVAPKERLAQLLILPFLPVEFVEVEDLDATERGAGGFGSTGV